jgi:anti-sigma regulatory factor (Ser/Thr protein kinase)
MRNGRQTRAEVELTMASNPDAPGVARRSLAELRAVVEPHVLEDLRLVVSELVTNSVRHVPVATGDRIDLRVQVVEGQIRVEVVNSEYGFVADAPAGPAGPGRPGWGLFLVDRMADRWGADAVQGGTRVWAELAAGAAVLWPRVV